MKAGLLIALAAGTGWAAPVAAQSVAAPPTVIVADTAPDRATGTVATQQGRTTTIDGGTRIGPNLFHSFQAFSLGTGDVALWLRSANDGASIRNVVSRVTGGAASSIDGTIASQGLPNADFFFINPAGVAFGANARLSLPNAVHFSTADALTLADGGRFAATTPGGSTLTIAAPAAFGFLGRGAAITIAQNESGDFIGPNARLSLSAGRIGIDRSVITPGALDLIAVGTAPGTTRIADPIGTRFGNGAIAIDGSFVFARASGGQTGTTRIAADQLRLSSSDVGTTSGITAPGGDLIIGANAIRIGAQSYLGTTSSSPSPPGSIEITTGLIEIDDAQLGSRSFQNAPGGQTMIRADTLRILNSGRITAGAGSTPEATGGDIDIVTRALMLESGGAIESSTSGPAAGGIISITANTASISGEAYIDTSTFGTGDAGALTLQADTLTLENGQIYSNAEEGSTGNAGILDLTVGALALRNGGRITTASFGNGSSGLIFVDAGQLNLGADSEIAANASGAGNAGLVTISSGAASIAGLIASESLAGSGTAGGIQLNATGPIAIAPSGQITTSSFTSGNAGLVLIRTPSLTIDGGAVRSIANDPDAGQSGSISVTAPLLTLINGGQIETSSANLLTAGEVVINGSTIRIDGTNSSLSSENISQSGGAAGVVTVTATRVELTNGGAISTNSLTGPAGDIVLDIAAGGTVLLRGGADPGVITTSSGPSTGGQILIANPYLILSDGGYILALGDRANANVQVAANFYIRSADRLNLIAVDGNLLVDSQVGDLSTGAEPIDVSFLDASTVLRGQCAAGGRGQSRFSTRVTGPYAATAPAPLLGGAAPVAALRQAFSNCRQ